VYAPREELATNAEDPEMVGVTKALDMCRFIERYPDAFSLYSVK